MRDTDYARELGSVSVAYEEGSEIRLERLLIKSTGVEEIRLSWWKDGKLMRAPADLPEEGLLELFRKGVRAHLFTPEFLNGLKAAISR
jgi:hypothetical protein